MATAAPAADHLPQIGFGDRLRRLRRHLPDVSTVEGRALYSLRFAYTQYLDAMTDAHRWGDLHESRRARYLRGQAETLAYVLAGWWASVDDGDIYGDRPAVLPNRSR